MKKTSVYETEMVQYGFTVFPDVDKTTVPNINCFFNLEFYIVEFPRNEEN